MMARFTPYVEDYNSQISEVVPLTRRHAHGPQRKSGLAHCEGVSDSGYESTLQSEPQTTSSPEDSGTPTPQNETPPPPPSAEQQTPQRRYHHSQPSPAPHLMTRRLSSHLSSQLSSQTSSSSNPTPSGSKPSSVKSASRSSSPAVQRGGPPSAPGPPSTAAPTSIAEEADCDCADCKITSKTSPIAQHSALSSPWSLNYPPFNSPGGVSAPHSSHSYSPYSTHSRSYSLRDYNYAYPPTPTTTDSGDSEPSTRRSRGDRVARPLSYGGAPIAVTPQANPVTTNGSWNAYGGGYYGGHLQGNTPVNSPPPPGYGNSSYPPPPPINTVVPASPLAQPYSAMVGGGGGGYSSYAYPQQDYYNQTQTQPATAAAPSSTSSDYSSMPPPPIPVRRGTNRLSSGGGLSSSPYGSPVDYTERYHEKYAKEYAERYGDKYSDKSAEKYSDRYSEKYSDKYADKYTDKYVDKYSGGYSEKYGESKHTDKYAPERYGDRYGDKYAEKYAPTDKYADKYYDKYADKYPDRYAIDKYADYHQQPPSKSSRRLSQRTSQGSGAYQHLQEVIPRSTSVPPSEANATIVSDSRWRTATPQPTSMMRRRDSTSTSGSAGALARIPSSALARSIEQNSAIDDDYYGRTPPSNQYYPPRYPYDHPAGGQLTTRNHQHVAYRNSDSSGGSSGGSSGEIMAKTGDETVSLTVPDGENNDSFTIRHPAGLPVKVQTYMLNGGATQKMTIKLGGGNGGHNGGSHQQYDERNQSVEHSKMHYRYVQHQQSPPQQQHQLQQLALQHDVSQGSGAGRQLEYDTYNQHNYPQYHRHQQRAIGYGNSYDDEYYHGSSRTSDRESGYDGGSGFDGSEGGYSHHSHYQQRRRRDSMHNSMSSGGV